jgi:NAD(P)-dependent dehydrogenase (short-subunit alcohol dehydrogenase family)
MSNYLVITGGSRGIGEKTIARFLQQGWKIVNLSRTACTLPEVINFSVDLSSATQIEQHADKLQQVLNNATKICLVHNAAFYKRDSADAMSLNDLQHTFAVNLFASVALNQIIIPLMKPNSSIIYIGSTLAEKAVPNAASYVISKHAIVGLMRVTCQDLKDKQIRSCCICPGLTDTKMLSETMDNNTISYLLENIVIGKRLIDPEEIAEVIHFCASNATINGITLHANLGQLAE